MPMLPLTDGELASMRTDLNVSLPGTAVISTPSRVADGQGGFTETFIASGTVSARLSPGGTQGDEGEMAGRIAESSGWILTLPYHTTVTEVDRVTYDSVTYEVAEVLTRKPWEISRRVRLKESD